MKIGEVIRKYRKEKKLTQEEVAGYLGVTAPAVNKWENGNSFPDISLLAPIARLLGISTDTLLSYREELTDKEIQQSVETVGSMIKAGEYHRAFQWAEKRIQEYPNCARLALETAQVLDSYRTIIGLSEPEQYDDKIIALYLRALDSTEYEVSQAAAAALFYVSIEKKEYVKARKYLDRIPKQGCNKKRLEAMLHQREGDKEEAYQLYEQILFSGYGDISWAFNGLYILAMEEGNLSKAEKLTEKQRGLAKLLEMGTYMEVSSGLDLAVYKKDREKVLELLAMMVDSLGDMVSYPGSDLYSHMKFSDAGIENLAFMLEKGLTEDESLSFIREDKRFQDLLEKLRSMVKE